jgi:hypothetical protein
MPGIIHAVALMAQAVFRRVKDGGLGNGMKFGRNVRNNILSLKRIAAILFFCGCTFQENRNSETIKVEVLNPRSITETGTSQGVNRVQFKGYELRDLVYSLNELGLDTITTGAKLKGRYYVNVDAGNSSGVDSRFLTSILLEVCAKLNIHSSIELKEVEMIQLSVVDTRKLETHRHIKIDGVSEMASIINERAYLKNYDLNMLTRKLTKAYNNSFLFTTDDYQDSIKYDFDLITIDTLQLKRELEQYGIVAKNVKKNLYVRVLEEK